MMCQHFDGVIKRARPAARLFVTQLSAAVLEQQAESDRIDPSVLLFVRLLRM